MQGSVLVSPFLACSEDDADWSREAGEAGSTRVPADMQVTRRPLCPEHVLCTVAKQGQCVCPGLSRCGVLGVTNVHTYGQGGDPGGHRWHWDFCLEPPRCG